MAPRRVLATVDHGSDDLRASGSAPVGLEPTALGLGIARLDRVWLVTCSFAGATSGVAASTGSRRQQFANGSTALRLRVPAKMVACLSLGLGYLDSRPPLFTVILSEVCRNREKCP